MTWPPLGRTRREHIEAEFDAAEEWEQSPIRRPAPRPREADPMAAMVELLREAQ